MNILIAKGVTLIKLTEQHVAAVQEAAGHNAVVKVAEIDDVTRELAADAEVIFGTVNADVFGWAPELKWMQSAGSGVDKLLFPAMMESDVVLTCEKGAVGSHLADHAMGLLLAITRQIASAVRDGRESWANRVGYRHKEFELTGKTMGILGFGSTGRHIARRAAAFGMSVRAIDAYNFTPSDEVAKVEPIENLADALAASDVIALGLAHTPKTRHILNDGTFGQMKEGAIVVNVCRGELIDPDALCRALDSGRLGGAGLDVTHVEPLPGDSPLWDYANVVLTPHTAGASQFRAERNIERFIDNLGRYRRGEELLGLVDKQEGF